MTLVAISSMELHGFAVAGRQHIVGDTMRGQQTVQPEPITSRLKAAHNANRGVEPASNTGAQRRDESEQGRCITAIDPM
jgi:hypothetical protein